MVARGEVVLHHISIGNMLVDPLTEPIARDVCLVQDIVTGNWWLSSVNDNEHIGYWPKSIFTSLADSASFVAWGGEVYNPNNRVLPQMGSGHFDPKEEHKSAYLNYIKVVSKNFKLEVPDKVTPSRMDDPTCYKAEYYDDIGGNLKKIVMYGGPVCHR
ncbi:uncharacterized protein LOC122649543 [Telopea speciosissima]|uniref:uncharacterized protein LOC122649543 n=1 Tax=Telopea speciosissima TaxID=54955 RepID=UPI001CC58CA6|nr:uncharacterized protein LOC122649543 [Telopea speciosissima]